MLLRLKLKSSTLELSSQRGFVLHYDTDFEKIEEIPFTFSSERTFESTNIALIIFPEGVVSKPWADEVDSSSKLGEMRTAFIRLNNNEEIDDQKSKQLILIDLFWNDSIFNTLLHFHHNDKVPKNVILGLDENTFLNEQDESSLALPKFCDRFPMISKPSIISYIFNA